MKIYSNTGGMAETNAYMVVDEATKTAAIIDAPQNTTASLLGIAKEQRYDVQCLLLTHGHWDHISDHRVVTEAFPKAKVLIHKLDEPKLQRPGSLLFELPYQIPPRNADGYIEDGQKIHVGHITLAAMHTPGHDEGHVVLYSNEHGVLFAGDLLMAGAVGRYDLEDGDAAVLKKSLHRVMLLPDATRVLPGHGPATTIGHERVNNPFIREWGLGG
ncbi:MAG TPA: MBL fold metallo-hydrolase [Phycisphaerae bacterium]|nr:MBL fold metallo-hydrolase [Phycisphaerae bacterium]